MAVFLFLPSFFFFSSFSLLFHFLFFSSFFFPLFLKANKDGRQAFKS